MSTQVKEPRWRKTIALGSLLRGPALWMIVVLVATATANGQRINPNQSNPRGTARQDGAPRAVADLVAGQTKAGSPYYQEALLIVPLEIAVANEGNHRADQVVVRATYQIGKQRQAAAFLVNGSDVAAIQRIPSKGSATLKGELRVVDRQRQFAGQTVRISLQVDPNNQIVESSKRNNVSRPLEVQLPNGAVPESRPPLQGNLVVPPTNGEQDTPPAGRGLSGGRGTRVPRPGSGGASGGRLTGSPPTVNPTGPGGLAGNQVLASVYRGDDGGAYYVRKLQNKVFIFGEHPGRDYAVVIDATINGQTISGKYWDVPKGSRANKGNLTLQVQDSGERLVVQNASGGFGVTTLQSYAIQNDQLPRAHRKPGFTSNSAADLDGAWRTGNGNLYIREVDGKVIAWCENDFSTGEKPSVAWIGIGTRGDNSQVAVSVVSVPKGQGTANGQASWIVDDAFHLRQLGGSKYVKDVVDFDKFEKEITNRFKNACVGFGYAIAHEGKIVRDGGWGNRLLSMDGGPLSFDADTQKCTQSTAKTITAAAVIHLLHANGMSVDDKIINYLPRNWDKGPGVEHLTFAHLLRHRSGLTDYGDPDEWENIKKTIQTGPSNMNWIVPQFEYRNVNYALFRVIIPYLDKPSDMHNFEDNGLSGASINERCSDRYRDYVRQNVLLPAGLANPQPHYTSSNVAYSYNYLNQNVAGYPQQDGQIYEMGAGGWIVSAKDYVKFLMALENGTILPDDRVSEMKSKGLGMFTISSAIGTAYMHGGSIGGGESGSYGSGRGARTHWMAFPNNVQVYITINSANNLGAAESSAARAEGLRDAFNASLYD